MASLHQLPSVEDAEREASEWIARLEADDVSADDRARFEAWRKAHPRHARAYEDLSATWDKFTSTGELVRAVALGQSLNESTQRAIQQAAPEVEPRVERTTGAFRRGFLLAAAASIGALVLGGVWWFSTLGPRTAFQTSIGERATIELPDGSFLELNSNSLARVDYREEARVIRLERGEAYFKVHHDTVRPFWVVAGNSWVRAVGTEFNVYVRPGGVQVTVSEGTVKVAAASSGNGTPSDERLAAESVAVLTAGKQLNMGGAATEVRSLPTVELTRSMLWRTGSVYFENRPLGEVVAELERYTKLQIVIDDEALRALPVGGTFQSDPEGAEALLTLLKDGFGLTVRRDGDTAYVGER